uniref:Uncharacterized protein n=1 Tax=Picocystis salinarum TaxID=88271 RepID=A0A7S3UF16_9CHLO|mmetsp:Transcript_7905/g.48857  ORF Transcript_7905/g.48857 Transcript_7905/m.48857 type:complete len:583 (+) Transcript_7905:116-1864(+)
MDNEERSVEDPMGTPQPDSTTPKDILTVKTVSDYLEKFNAESFLTDTSRAFMKEVGESVSSDYLKLQKNLLSVRPSTPKQLVTCTFMQNELNLVPKEWNGLKIQNRKGRFKGVWSLMSIDMEGKKDKQWYMHNVRTQESRYIPSLEQVFAILHLKHPRKCMPLYQIALREVYSMLQEDTSWVMPGKRLVFLSMRHVRTVKGMGKKVETDPHAVSPVQEDSQPNFQSLPSWCHKCMNHENKKQLLETSSKNWKVALAIEWRAQNLRSSLEPLGSRLKLVARILSESHQTVNCLSPSENSTLVHKALVTQYGLVPIDIKGRSKDTEPSRLKVAHHLWLLMMLKEEPSSLPPPLDVLTTLWEKLLAEAENEGAESSVAQNYNLCVQKVDLRSLCRVCCPSYSLASPETGDHGIGNIAQSNDLEVVAPCLLNARQDAHNYLHRRKRQRQEDVAQKNAPRISRVPPHPLCFMFVPFLVKEQVAVVIPMAKVTLGEETTWSSVKAQDTPVSSHISFLWQTFEEKGGLIHSSFQDEPWLMNQVGVQFPRLIFLWDGLDTLLPLIGQELFEGLEEALGRIETSKPDINKK